MTASNSSTQASAVPQKMYVGDAGADVRQERPVGHCAKTKLAYLLRCPRTARGRIGDDMRQDCTFARCLGSHLIEESRRPVTARTRHAVSVERHRVQLQGQLTVAITQLGDGSEAYPRTVVELTEVKECLAVQQRRARTLQRTRGQAGGMVEVPQPVQISQLAFSLPASSRIQNLRALSAGSPNARSR